MKVSRRTLTWAAISTVPVLTAFAFAEKNLASIHKAKVSSSGPAHQAAPAAPQVQAASAARRNRLHLKRGHTYQLSMTEMASITGGSSGYTPGSTFTMAAFYGASGESTPGFSGWYLDDGSGPVYSSGSAANAGGWVVRYTSTTKTITVTVSPSAKPGSSYFAFVKTGTTRFAMIDPIGGNGPMDIGYKTDFFTID